MKKNSKLIIEQYLLTLIKMELEMDSDIDKFGNIVYRNKKELIEKINKDIERESRELEEDVEEVKKYLVRILENESSDKEKTQESLKIKELLEINNKKLTDTDENNREPIK